MREDLKESTASEEGYDNEEKNVSRETSERLAVSECSINYATALAGVAEHYLASHGDAGTLAAADRYQVLFHINENAAHIDHKIEQGHCCYIDEGPFLAPEVAARLACSASVTPVLENDAGDVLNVGRRSRTRTMPSGNLMRNAAARASR